MTDPNDKHTMDVFGGATTELERHCRAALWGVFADGTDRAMEELNDEERDAVTRDAAEIAKAGERPQDLAADGAVRTLMDRIGGGKNLKQYAACLVAGERRRAATPPPHHGVQVVPRKPKREKPKSRAQRWADAVQACRDAHNAAESAMTDLEDALEQLREVQAEYTEWKDNLDGRFEGSALVEKLEAVSDIDIPDDGRDLDEVDNVLGECEGADLPLGFGRD